MYIIIEFMKRAPSKAYNLIVKMAITQGLS